MKWLNELKWVTPYQDWYPVIIEYGGCIFNGLDSPREEEEGADAWTQRRESGTLPSMTGPACTSIHLDYSWNRHFQSTILPLTHNSHNEQLAQEEEEICNLIKHCHPVGTTVTGRWTHCLQNNQLYEAAQWFRLTEIPRLTWQCSSLEGKTHLLLLCRSFCHISPPSGEKKHVAQSLNRRFHVLEVYRKYWLIIQIAQRHVIWGQD